MKTKIKPEDFGKVKVDNTGRRMKLYIKLNKEETEMWNAMKDAFTDGQLGDDQLARIFMFKGIDAINRELDERIAQMSDEEKEAIIEQINNESEETTEN